MMNLLSLAAIPPLVGFFAKLQVLFVTFDKGYMLLALIAILTSIISAAYYLRLIKFMYFFPELSFNKPVYVVEDVKRKSTLFNLKNKVNTNNVLPVENYSINMWEYRFGGFFPVNNNYRKDTSFYSNISNVTYKTTTLPFNLTIAVAIISVITLSYVLKPSIVQDFLTILVYNSYGLTYALSI